MGSPAPAARIVRIALLDQVYDLTKERILDRGYGPGHKLNIEALARELSVSATPVREALGRLTAEGLLVAEPYVGFSVAPMPDRKYFSDLFAFRALVEPWAAAQAALNATPALLAELEAALTTMRKGQLSKTYRAYRTHSEADETFHRALISGANNEAAAKAYADLHVHLHLSRLYIDRDQDTAATLAQHQGILDAVRERQPEAAAQQMAEHLRLSQQKLLGNISAGQKSA